MEWERLVQFVLQGSSVSSTRKATSSYQQDLPATALFCRRLRLGRVTEW
jgi:hypothetical protein